MSHSLCDLREVVLTMIQHFYTDEGFQHGSAYPSNVTNVRDKMRFHRKKHDEEEGTSSVSTGTGEANGNTGAANVATPTAAGTATQHADDDEEEEEQPQMNIISTVVCLPPSTVVSELCLCHYCADVAAE